MSNVTAQQLTDAIKLAGFQPKPYSGRGMFGAFCVSVNVDRGQEAKLFSGMAKHLADIPGYSQDSMGLGTVIYWRQMPTTNISFPADDPEEDEEDAA